MKLLLIVILNCMYLNTAFGVEIPEAYTPVVPLGMGGAYTGIANDENSVWTNPAGVARIRKARSRKHISLVSVPNLEIGVNANAKSVYKGYSSNKDSSLADIISGSQDLSSGSTQWAMFSASPIIFFDMGKQGPSAVGAFSHTTTKAVVEQETPDQSKVTIISDLGALLTLGATNKTNRFNSALQLRYISRYAYEDTIPTETLKQTHELITKLKEGSNQLTALAVDIGTMFTLADYWFPTIGVAILNIPLGCKDNYLNPFNKTRQTICGTKFSGSIKNEDALSIIDPTDIRVGVSITPRLSKKIGLRIALDMHHLYYASGNKNYGLPDVDINKTFHGGLELFLGNPLLPSPFSIKTGYGQGFVSFGASIRLAGIAIDFTSYGRDVSSETTKLEDRRYLVGLSYTY